LAGDSPVIIGDGKNSRDFTYIDNVIQANQRAATTPTQQIKENQKRYYNKVNVALQSENDHIYEVVNIAHGERTDLNQLFAALKEILGTNSYELKNLKPHYGPARDGDIPHSHASIEKANHLIGYQPTFNFKQGIKHTTDWYIKNII
jgi:UDP-N-acetylglucosamine 4-epimerase